MIDLHCHVLPAIDDGAATLEHSRAMLEASRSLGFTHVAATPHLVGALSPAYQHQVSEAFAAVEDVAKHCGITLIPGFEIRLSPDLPRRLAQGEISFLASTTALLIDLPFGGWPHWAEQTLFDLQLAGYQPILAHPERYPEVQKDPEMCLRLAHRGIAVQVTIGSFSGILGKRTKLTAEALIALGAVHLVATDAHSAGGDRMTAVPEGLKRLGSLVGQNKLEHLLLDAPQALLAGGCPSPIVPPERTWWSRFTLRR